MAAGNLFAILYKSDNDLWRQEILRLRSEKLRKKEEIPGKIKKYHEKIKK